MRFHFNDFIFWGGSPIMKRIFCFTTYPSFKTLKRIHLSSNTAK